MEEVYWERFTHSGQVTDYLAYKSCEAPKQEQTGGKYVESYNNSDRYYHDPDTDGRIR